MNRKLFLNIVFMITGSFIVIAMTVIVAVNFVNDSRLFQKSASNVDVKKDATAVIAPQESSEESADENSRTYQYNRTPGIENDNNDHGEEKTKPAETKKSDKIKVYVVNYSGIKNLAEQIKTTLEASGYEVSAGNETSSQPVKTVIIDLKSKKAAPDIQKIIKVGTVRNETNLASRFDVLVKIGDDYKP